MDREISKTDIEGQQELSQEVVREIEGSLFDKGDKVSILLVKAGLKPAAMLYLDKTGEGELTDREIEESKKLLENLGPCKEGRHFNEEYELKSGGTDKIETVEFLIGSTPENLQKLILAMKHKSEYEIGLALGYCPTAVEAYCGEGEILDETEILGQDWARRAMVFKLSKLSAEHFREELAYYEKWADYVERTSPELYKKMMGI